jgi:hypothetical protein
MREGNVDKVAWRAVRRGSMLSGNIRDMVLIVKWQQGELSLLENVPSPFQSGWWQSTTPLAASSRYCFP